MPVDTVVVQKGSIRRLIGLLRRKGWKPEQASFSHMTDGRAEARDLVNGLGTFDRPEGLQELDDLMRRGSGRPLP